MLFRHLIELGFDVLALHHAEAIISKDFPEAESELEQACAELDLPILEVIGSGGGETKLTQRLRRRLAENGWDKRNIQVRKTVRWADDEPEIEVASLSHEIDHVKSFPPNGSVFALEIEWNNKDPFFDRDLENFKRLHAEGAISVGGLITRGSSLHSNMRDHVRRFAVDNDVEDFEKLDSFGYTPTRRQRENIVARAERMGSFREAWVDWFVSDKYGEATTHWRKLQERVLRGVGNPCPLVLIGIPDSIVTFNYSAASTEEL
ncbi:BglII/BstYI family type II restriction endonuclease [Oricola sp.]|uniref:BglII/BstYI family type II restriction endonuclease n=1 Tax=Oricola sp. TaxID=1979950 RepID=UPI003BA8ECCC